MDITIVSNTADNASGRHFNGSAIRAHALECSNKIKGGKFTRVGQDFIDEVQADIECLVREIKNKYPVQVHEPVPCDLKFTTGALMDRIEEALNLAIPRLIQNKVQRQPSCGKTLSRTR